MSSNQDRERALEKVRKLLAMANDGRGNVNEAEAAARQAASLMAKFNIESAEAQLADLCGDEPDLTQEFYDGNYDPGAKGAPKGIPSWLGILAVGVGRLCQVKVDGAKTKDERTAVRFSGYSTDVAFAQWLMQVLAKAVFFQARTDYGHGSKADRESFRYAASSRLQARCMAMRTERDDDLKARAASSQEGTGTALAVIDKKAQAIAEAFGEQRVKKTKKALRHDAAAAGRSFGDRCAIPTGRPISSGPDRARIAA